MLTPERLVSSIKGIPKLQRGEFVEKFKNEEFTITGIITSLNDWGWKVTVDIDLKSGVAVSCNFEKPISSEMELLNEGDSIEVTGKLYNFSERLVVLDNCEIPSKVKKHKMSDYRLNISGNNNQVAIDHGVNTQISKKSAKKNPLIIYLFSVFKKIANHPWTVTIVGGIVVSISVAFIFN